MTYTWDDIGLCCGSIARAGFRELAEAASGAGFRGITLWPVQFERALADGLEVRDLRRILADNGLVVTEIDPLVSWLPGDPGELAGPFAAYDESTFYRMADALGARSLNAIRAGREPVPRDALVDALGSLCERAEAHGLIVSFEFMPWSPVASLEAALELVRATGKADCGVNVDTWHHFRSGGTVEALAALDPATVAALQLNDVAPEPWDDVLAETATGRRLPGEGASDTVAVLEALAGAGVRAPINVEVFSAELQRLSDAEAARRIAASTRSVLARLDGA